MKLRTLLVLAALLLTTLPGHAQQVTPTTQSVTMRVLHLPDEFLNVASFTEWNYAPTNETLSIGDENAGVILLGKKWHNGANLWLPLGLNARGSLNLQLNPCSGTTSTMGEAYNDMVRTVMVDESVLTNDFTLTFYEHDTPDGGAGEKLTLSSEDFANAKTVEMFAITAPSDSNGKVSGITSSFADEYDKMIENLGGIWLGENALPIRGVGLNQGERFTSAQVPPCEPAGAEFSNDLGDAVLLLPRDTACVDGTVILHEDDLDNTPNGNSWPIHLDQSLCEQRPPTAPDEEPGLTTIHLPLLSNPTRTAPDEEPNTSCAEGKLIITNAHGTYERPLDSPNQLTVPNLPLTATTFTVEGAYNTRFVKYSPGAIETINNNTYTYPGGNPGAELRLEVFSNVGEAQCHANVRANVDP